MAEQTLNIPQIFVFLVVSALVIRWLFSKPSTSGAQSAHSGRGDSRISPAQIDQIASMFPQLDRRMIAWDLQRNGGNVAATTERVLSGRSLETPPVAFSPPLPRPNTPSRTATPQAKPSQPNLIARYNLASKLGQEPDPKPEEKPKGWSADKNERQANLQRRREEMILAARRKMEQQGKASGASV